MFLLFWDNLNESIKMYLHNNFKKAKIEILFLIIRYCSTEIVVAPIVMEKQKKKTDRAKYKNPSRHKT